jgi:23S rRNA (uracil1939-C5)-methyltransferase
MTVKPMEKFQTIQITGMAYGGEGVGRLADGRVVFCPFVLPGETVKIDAVVEKPTHVRARLVAVVEPSVNRIDARCRHFGVCGGCHYQHLTNEEQLSIKTGILADQLQRIGRLDAPAVDPIRPSPNPWRYRNSVRFQVDPEGKLGFQRALTNDMVPVQECHIIEQELVDIWSSLDIESLAGLRQVMLRKGIEGDLQVVLFGDDPIPPELSVDYPVSIIYQGPNGSQVLSGDQALIMRVMGANFRVSAGSFFQANLPQAEAMVAHLMANLAVTKNDTLVDAYCGVGLFSTFFAQKAGKVIGIESSPSACEDYAANLDMHENIDLYAAPTSQALHALAEKVDIVIVDPPREGLKPEVRDTIIRMEPSRLVYVSCNPATLSRDIRHFTEAGFCLERVTPFDLFPQTYHIEAVALLKRSS